MIILEILVKTYYRGDGGYIVELSECKKFIGCKCLFTVKHKADGSIKKDKARLVVGAWMLSMPNLSSEVVERVGAIFVPLEYSPKIPPSSPLLFLPAKQIGVKGPHPGGVGQRPSDA
ncbi:unnamed protein product [Prunus brigantina]